MVVHKKFHKDLFMCFRVLRNRYRQTHPKHNLLMVVMRTDISIDSAASRVIFLNTSKSEFKILFINHIQIVLVIRNLYGFSLLMHLF